MRISTISALTALGVVVSVQPALAASCYDLWYERNAIYDRNGYCFSTRLGQDTFDNSDCYTKDVQFSQSEQHQIDRIRNEEYDRGCNVN